MPRINPSSVSGQFIKHVEYIESLGGSIADSFTDSGKVSLLAALRAGAPYASALALAGDKLNVGDRVVERAAKEMEAAAPKATQRGLYDEPEHDDAEPYYLLGILVGPGVGRRVSIGGAVVAILHPIQAARRWQGRRND